MTKVLVSIVNWNNSAATNNCLASIGKLSESSQPDVVVVDNHSTEGELKVDPDIKKSLKYLKVIKNSQNLGFAGGHNENIKFAREAGYDYIFLLNNDSELVDQNLFDELVEALQSNPKALGANPTILSSVDPNIVWYGGGRLSLVTSYASHLQVGADMTGAPGGIQKASLLTGGCLAIALKRASLEQLLLSEEYFLYWEDTDWCARAAKAGYELLYVPRARLLHHVSSSLGVRSPAYIYYNLRNHFLFVWRNVSPLWRPLCWLRIVLITLKYKLNILLRYRQGRLKAFGALWKGWADGITGRTGPLRRKI